MSSKHITRMEAGTLAPRLMADVILAVRKLRELTSLYPDQVDAAVGLFSEDKVLLKNVLRVDQGVKSTGDGERHRLVAARINLRSE